MKVAQTLTSFPRRIALWALWCAAHIALFTFGYLRTKNDHSIDAFNRIGPSFFIAKASGLTLIMDTALIFLPMCRILVVRLAPVFSKMLGISLGHTTTFHRVIASTIFFFTAIHVVAHLFNFAALQRFGVQSALYFNFESIAGVTGYLMLIVLILMFITAHNRVRSKHFEIFMIVHSFAAIFIILFIVHPLGCIVKTPTGECKNNKSYYYVVPGCIVYLIERIARLYRSMRETTIIDAIAHPAGVVEIRLQASGFEYESGQYAYLNIPSISRHEWHPFTITSAPHQDHVSFHIHRAGNWTTRMGETLCVGKIEGGKRDYEKGMAVMSTTIHIDGPFGQPTSGVFDEDVAILVGGGIGVTPCASIIRDMYWRHRCFTTGRLRRVEFYWVCRTMESYEWFRDDLIEMLKEGCESFIRVHCFVTAKGSLPTSGSDAPDPILNVKQGRPDFEKIFSEVASEELVDVGERLKSLPKIKIGVYVCGPRPLEKGIQQAAAKTNVKGSKIKVTLCT